MSPMRFMLKSKIHRCTVTDANVNYEGSVTIDRTLMNASGIIPYEEVHIWNVGNGERLVTYAIEGPADSGMICINGAAARRVHKGDIVIISCYAAYTEAELKNFKSVAVFVDGANRMVKK